MYKVDQSAIFYLYREECGLSSFLSWSFLLEVNFDKILKALSSARFSIRDLKPSMLVLMLLSGSATCSSSTESCHISLTSSFQLCSFRISSSIAKLWSILKHSTRFYWPNFSGPSSKFSTSICKALRKQLLTVLLVTWSHAVLTPSTLH